MCLHVSNDYFDIINDRWRLCDNRRINSPSIHLSIYLYVSIAGILTGTTFCHSKKKCHICAAQKECTKKNRVCEGFFAGKVAGARKLLLLRKSVKKKVTKTERERERERPREERSGKSCRDTYAAARPAAHEGRLFVWSR